MTTVIPGKNAEKQKIVDKKDDEDWGKGMKGAGAKEDKASKAAEAALKKAELARLTKLEEDSQPSKKPSAKPAKPKPLPPAKKVGLASSIPDFEGGGNAKGDAAGGVEEFSGTGIDNALEMMSLVGEKMDKASVGSRAAVKVEQHPERRFKVGHSDHSVRIFRRPLFLLPHLAYFPVSSTEGEKCIDSIPINRPHSKRIKKLSYQLSNKIDLG